MTNNRPLRVFLCHSSQDKPAVRELYQKLRAEAWIQPWLDEEELYPGQDWNMEIEKAVEAADAIIVCLTKGSITKEGYIQRELRIVLDYADYKPEGTLYIMPVRLEECEPPRRLRPWQYADYFEGQRERAFQRLLVSLEKRADSLDLKIEEPVLEKDEKPEEKNVLESSKPRFLEYPTPEWIIANKIILSNGMEFMRVPAGEFLMGSDNHHSDEAPRSTISISYDYWMSRFPVTNEQYSIYASVNGIDHPVENWENKKEYPVVRVNWVDAMKYSQWLSRYLNDELSIWRVLRLPTEAEWEKAARGTDGREYPWGNQFDKNKANTNESRRGFPTPASHYSPQGDSPYGCADMVGNVWEWCHSLLKKYPYDISDGREDENANKNSDSRCLRGGSYNESNDRARVSFRSYRVLHSLRNDNFGFRVVLAPRPPK